MIINKSSQLMVLALGALVFAACASQPVSTPSSPSAAAAPAATTPVASQDAAKAEADAAGALEKKFQEAARSYKTVQKDGKTLYCKREKQIGSTIPTMNCMTESQLRNEVENMEAYRDRARNAAKCTHGAGCGAGS